MIITFIILSAIVSFILNLFPVLYNHLVMRIKLIWLPGPFTPPFIGLFLTVVLFSKDEILRKMWESGVKHKKGMYLVWLGLGAKLFLGKPHQIELILKSPTLITKSSGYAYLIEWLGNGLVTSTGDIWHRHRRMLTPAFHFGVLDQFSDVIFNKVTILNDSIKSLHNENPSKPINIYPMAIKFTLDAACTTIMGLDLDVQRQGGHEYVEALHNFVELATQRYFCFWFWSDRIFNLSSAGKLYRHSAKTMHDFTRKVINEKMKMRKESGVKITKTKADDESRYSKLTPFLDLLIDLSEADDSPLTLEEIREEVDTFMFAAHDTTGITISYVLFCLGNYPEVQEKVYDEIQEVVPNNREAPTKQQLAQLKYLERVIKEALRLFPAAPFVMRKLTHDTEIDGYRIPKGVDVHIQIMQMHWDPEIWPDPTKFDPDRFLPENSVGRHPYAYIPFSAGPRNCIGQKFAMLLLKISLVKILKEWKVHSQLPIVALKYSTQFVQTPPDQTINLRFERRRQY